jgi:hypothetical protein
MLRGYHFVQDLIILLVILLWLAAAVVVEVLQGEVALVDY